MSCTAFIFARGGSKGVPGKNLREVGGKSLIARAVESAAQAKHVVRVVISTDDQAIAEAARAAGADVPFMRPSDLAGDTSAELLAWQHAITTLAQAGEFDLENDLFVSVPCTAPLRTSDDVDRCIERLINDQADMVITVTPAARHPSFNMVKAVGKHVELVNPVAHDVIRRQDAEPVFDMTTVAYVAKPSYILNWTTMFAGKVSAVEIPAERAIDVDTPLDLAVADMVAKGEVSL